MMSSFHACCVWLSRLLCRVSSSAIKINTNLLFDLTAKQQQKTTPETLTFAGEGASDLHSPLLEEAILCAIVSVISTACSRLQPLSVHSHHIVLFLFHYILFIYIYF